MGISILRFVLALLSLFLFTPVNAQPLGIIRSATGSSAPFAGPGDVVSGAKAFWGLRAYTAAIAAAGTQKLINIRRTSDAETCDVFVATNGGLGLTTGCSGADNGLTPAAFCNATTCFVTKIYDQTLGAACTGSCDLVQAVAGTQPALTFNCSGSLPCMTFSAHNLVAAGAMTQAQAFTISAVAKRTGSFTVLNSIWSDGGGNDQIGFNTANTGYQFATTVDTITGVNDSVFHAIQAIFNGASSNYFVDGTTNTQNPGAVGISGAHAIGFASGAPNFLVGTITEVGVWAGSFSGPQLTSMNSNQHAYWGF